MEWEHLLVRNRDQFYWSGMGTSFGKISGLEWEPLLLVLNGDQS